MHFLSYCWEGLPASAFSVTRANPTPRDLTLSPKSQNIPGSTSVLCMKAAPMYPLLSLGFLGSHFPVPFSERFPREAQTLAQG